MCVFPFAHQGSVVTYGRFTAQAPMDDCEPLEGAPEQEDRQQKRGIVNDPEQKS